MFDDTLYSPALLLPLSPLCSTRPSPSSSPYQTTRSFAGSSPSQAESPSSFPVNTLDIDTVQEPSCELCVTGTRLKYQTTYLDRAIRESIRSKSRLPLIKEELRRRIHCSRDAQGKPITVEKDNRPKVYKLRKDEIEKRNDRLRQNRESAYRARERSLARERDLLEYVDKATKEHDELFAEKNTLEDERNTLQNFLDEHSKVCRIAVKETVHEVSTSSAHGKVAALLQGQPKMDGFNTDNHRETHTGAGLTCLQNINVLWN